MVIVFLAVGEGVVVVVRVAGVTSGILGGVARPLVGDLRPVGPAPAVAVELVGVEHQWAVVIPIGYPVAVEVTPDMASAWV